MALRVYGLLSQRYSKRDYFMIPSGEVLQPQKPKPSDGAPGLRSFISKRLEEGLFHDPKGEVLQPQKPKPSDGAPGLRSLISEILKRDYFMIPKGKYCNLKSPNPPLSLRVYGLFSFLLPFENEFSMAAGMKKALFCCRKIGLLRLRRKRDSNPRSARADNGFQDRRIRPLCHSSGRKSNTFFLIGNGLPEFFEKDTG